jgi:Na+/proline symporter
MSEYLTGVELVFFLTLVITFGAAYLGRKHANARAASKQDNKGEHLNKWLVGLSAGATANSGFIVTGAVGLGYISGPQWLFLPLSWFLGDLIFWRFFPQRINRVGQDTGSSTMSELLKSGLNGKVAKIASIFATVLIVVCLGGYTSAQWIAGQKFIAGAFELSSHLSLILFALVVIAYTSIGGFRGSIYADSVQAIIRILGTAIALVAVIYLVLGDLPSFSQNIADAGPAFSTWLPGTTISALVFFVLGYACASFGFGLGQPQVMSRYLAGKSPQETQSAKWIYIGFVQFTWLSMTLFGVLLRGVMPDISDPEAGLSVFFSTYFGTIITGIIVADVFATIAATSNSLLITMAQAMIHDFVPKHLSRANKRKLSLMFVFVLGFFTMAGATYLANESTVFEIALGSISLMGAGLAAAVIVKVLNWQRTGISFLASMVCGFSAAIVWKHYAMDAMLNEAGIGIAVGLLANWLCVKATSIKTNKHQSNESREY